MEVFWKWCGGSNLSNVEKHLFWIIFAFGRGWSVVVQICPKHRCIYGFVNKFWTGRIFERLWKVCGGSNLSTVSVLKWIYIKKCISPVRIRLRVKKPRNASTKFRKTSESKKAEKSLEISAFLVFSCLHLNQTRIMAGMAGFGPTNAGVKVLCLTAWRHPNDNLCLIFSDRIILPHSRCDVKSWYAFLACDPFFIHLRRFNDNKNTYKYF